MEMRLLKHAFGRDEHKSEVPRDAARRRGNRRPVFRRLTARYSTSLTTIKSLTHRIVTLRAEPAENASDGPPPDESQASDGAEPRLSLAGRLAHHDDAADNEWTAYSKKYREEHCKKLSEKPLGATGNDEHRFELIEVDRAWWRMKVGEIPDNAANVWEVLDTPLPVHLIAEDQQLAVREVVFWLTVFKRHLDVREEMQSERCVYVRDEEPADLSTAIAEKVQALH